MTCRTLPKELIIEQARGDSAKKPSEFGHNVICSGPVELKVISLQKKESVRAITNEKEAKNH